MTPLTYEPETFPAMPYLAAPDDPLLVPPGTRLLSRPLEEWLDLHRAPEPVQMRREVLMAEAA